VVKNAGQAQKAWTLFYVAVIIYLSILSDDALNGIRKSACRQKKHSNMNGFNSQQGLLISDMHPLLGKKEKKGV
jgi:hypothetical protein